MALLGAEDRVCPGRDVAYVELYGVPCGDQLAGGDAGAPAVADREVVLGRTRVAEPEDDLAVSRVDRRGVELELRHRHLDRARRSARAASTAAARGKQERSRDRRHLFQRTSATPT